MVRKMETENLLKRLDNFIAKQDKPVQGKYKPEFEQRRSIDDALAPYQVGQHQINSQVNPALPPNMGFGANAPDNEHVVDNYVPFDKTNVFQYKGKLYDASKIPEDILAVLMPKIE